MKCPTCNTENPADSQFCHKCGSSIDISTSPTLSYSPAQETAIGESLKFNPGEKFGDRYTIIEEIGRGGMGRVEEARKVAQRLRELTEKTSFPKKYEAIRLSDGPDRP